MSWLRPDSVDISKYLPDFLQSEEDFRNVLTVESSEHERQRLIIADLLDQMFLFTETWALSRWESILQLTPKAGATYEERRHEILLKLCGRQTSTVRFMEWLVNQYTDIRTGSKILEDNANYRFTVQIEGLIADKPGLKKAIETYKPAHLGYGFLYVITDRDLHDEPIGDLTLKGDEFVASVRSWFRDVVPYGNALNYPKYDGTYRASDMYHVGSGRADGALQVGSMLPGALRVQEGIDWQFIYDGPAFADGTFRADGSLVANGECPWRLQYNDFMDELSILIITMRRPDGTTELEDDVVFYPAVGDGIRACGGARAGKTQSPVDNCGRLEVTRSHRANGAVRVGAEMNVADGSIIADGSFQADGGGIHPRIDVLRDDLCGSLSIRRPKKHPPLALRYPEFFDTVKQPEEDDGTVAMLDGFADSPCIDDKALRIGGFRADGSARIGAGNILPLDTGGTLTIIHVLTANGTRKADGGLSYKADGSYKVGGIQLKEGNQIGITSRHDEIL